MLGLALVLTALGSSAGLVGQVLLDYRGLTLRVAGLAIVLFGLYQVGLLRLGLLSREKRVDFLAVRGRGALGAFLMGGAFALGWTPCVGAVLGSILLLASQSDTLWTGAALLFAYSLGLGLPFLAAALAAERWAGLSQHLKRRLRALQLASGTLLVALGVLLFTDRLALLTGWVVRAFGAGLTL